MVGKSSGNAILNERRFEMIFTPLLTTDFDPEPDASVLAVSTPNIISLSCILASLQIFERVGFEKYYARSQKLVDLFFERYFEKIVSRDFTKIFHIITPADCHGSQVSIEIDSAYAKEFFSFLMAHKIIADFRHPTVVRISFNGFYNKHAHVDKLIECMMIFLLHHQNV